MKKGLTNIHIITTNNINGAMFHENNKFNIYKFSTYIKLARQSGHAILLNNGPFLTGSAISEYYASLKEYKRIPLITVMDMLKFNATNISCNDLSLGFKYFSRAHAMSEFPFLSCNILNVATKEPYFNTPYVIHHYKGIKIGIIALSEESVIDAEEIIVSNPMQSLKTWVRYMYDKENPDFVIALHNGLIDDLCTNENVLCTEGIHILITTSEHNEAVMHDLTEMIHVPEATSVVHIQLTFKERTNSYELVGSTHEYVDITRYQEDFLLKEMMYYDEKEYMHHKNL
ncbi:hypothetical protein ACMGE7_03760 [Macrococcus equi]|uniref:hypothetical protein n=1 Tax=Macrococcus equi TaxID=3395462 RepID=UPI0039BDFD30